MSRILLVDDDKLLVKKIKDTVRWDEIGISMVYTANSVRQAQKLIADFPIDILLCDIDMPQGNGLELLEWVRDQGYDIECAFLSSYANFAYAQKAVSLASKEYLLKPISSRDLEGALKRIADEVGKKQVHTEVRSDNSTEQFWESFIFRKAEGGAILQQCCQSGRYEEGERFSFVIIKMLNTYPKECFKEAPSQFKYVIHHIATDLLGGRGCPPETVVHLGDFECLMVFRMPKRPEDLKEAIYEIREYINTALPKPSVIYMGKHRQITELEAGQEQIEEMEKFAVPDGNGIIFEEEWCVHLADYETPHWDIWKKEMLGCDSMEKTVTDIHDYIEQQSEKKKWTTGTLARFIRELNQLLYRYLGERGMNFGQLFNTSEFECYEKNACLSLDGAHSFTAYIFEKLEGNLHSGDKKENIIEQVKAFIEEHLKEELSRKILAEKVFLSEVYISKLFASVTGMSIPAYISSRRIEKAKQYLTHSGLSVSKIAIEVGYSNFSYFSKTFRDLVGCTPNEYRSRLVRER